MKIKDLPQPYREMALIELEAQGNKRNENIKLDKSTYQGNFRWAESILDYSFWANVYNQDYPEITPEIKEKFPSVFKDELIEKWKQDIKEQEKFAQESKEAFWSLMHEARIDQLKQCIKDYQEFINLKK